MDKIDEILEGCRQGNRKSQEQLYRQFYPGLFALCKKFFDDNHDIVTSLNNGMLNVYKNIGLYDPQKGTLFNWAYAIVRYSVLTYLRNKKTIREHSMLTEDTEPVGTVNPFKDLEWKDIYVYLSKLPTSTRAVCTLYYIEGFAIKEIALQLDASEGTIKWHMYEGRKKLKYILTTNLTSKSA